VNRLGLKIVSLVIAIILWIQVASSHMETRVVQLPLRLRNLPEQLTMAGNDIPAHVTIRGRSSKLNFLLHSLLRRSLGEVVVDLGELRPGVQFERAISPADVVSGMEDVEVVPPVTLSLFVDSLAVRRLPVRVVFKGELPRDRLLVGSVTAVPGSVTVQGPSRQLADVTELTTAPVDLGRIRRPAELVREVVPPADHLEVVPAEVTVRVPVAVREERLFEHLPVVALVDAGLSGVDVFPPVVTVRISGPADTLAILTPAAVAVTVPTSGLGPGEHTLRPDVLLPPSCRLEEITPAAVTVVVGRDRERRD